MRAVDYNYGPEQCLATAAASLEKIFQKHVDAKQELVQDGGVTATTESSFSSPLATKPSASEPAPLRDSADCRRAGSEFSLHGYFEEFLSMQYSTPKGLGVIKYALDLPPSQQGRALGSSGRREFVLTENLTLIKGHREVLIKASPARPLRVVTMLQKLEGR